MFCGAHRRSDRRRNGTVSKWYGDQPETTSRGWGCQILHPLFTSGPLGNRGAFIYFLLTRCLLSFPAYPVDYPYVLVNPLLSMPGTGVEPVHSRGARDFKSLASACSATQALSKSFYNSKQSGLSTGTRHGPQRRLEPLKPFERQTKSFFPVIRGLVGSLTRANVMRLYSSTPYLY